MITAQFDMAKLRRSLEKAAGNFGETNKQAIPRWGVQTCRELAVSTQAYGRTGTRKKQIASIDAGIASTIHEVTEKQFQRLQSGRQRTAQIRGRWVNITAERLLSSLDAANSWIDQHRGSKGRAHRLPPENIAIAPKSLVAQVRRDRHQRAGLAKEGWLDAGAAIGRMQKGAEQINIGKNFLGYAQRPAVRGSAQRRGDGYRAMASLRNHLRHSKSQNVLTESEKSKAIGFGARKTIAWYRRAAKKALDK